MEKKQINVAFFDSEFTAITAKDRGLQELIQCAVIIYSIEISSCKQLLLMDNDPIASYNTFVKPVYKPNLSPYIKQLTGIKQDEVDGGISLSDAIENLYNILKQHDVSVIITWGPDKMMLRQNFSLVKHDHQKAHTILNLITDVSYDVSKKLGYSKAIAQTKACKMLHIKKVGKSHNAYDDARNLSQIVRNFAEESSVEYNQSGTGI